MNLARYKYLKFIPVVIFTLVAGCYIFNTVSSGLPFLGCSPQDVTRFIARQFGRDCLLDTERDGGIACLVTTKTAGNPEKTISILFIGNSLTYINGLPTKFANIASSDDTNKIRFKIQSVTAPGVSLSDLWRNPDVQLTLKSRHWDFIVLQERSSWSYSPQSIQETNNAVFIWNAALRKMGTVPVLIQNWSDKAGSEIYTNPSYYLYGRDPDSAQKEFSNHTDEVAKYFNIDVIPLGDFWAYIRKLPGAPDLYNSDGHHPGVAGAYLSALIFYRFFVGHKPDHTTYVPQGITTEQIKIMMDAVP